MLTTYKIHDLYRYDCVTCSVQTLKTYVMKRCLFALIAFCLTAGTSCQKEADIEKEKAAVKTTIEKSFEASNEIDFDGMVDFWVKEDYAFISTASNETHALIQGWESINEMVEGAKKWGLVEAREAGNYQTEEPFDFSIIRVNGDVAWVQFKIKWSHYKNNVKTGEDESLELYILEKHNGDWKIACISEVFTSGYEAKAKVEDNGSDDDIDGDK